jgi:hypothetical protein
MSKHFRPLNVFFILTIVILACALPVPSVGQPTQSSGTAILPSSPDPNKVGTVVAMTLTALAPKGDNPIVPTIAPATEAPTTVLPHTLYYLGTDSAGIIQVFRIEQDGTTRRQLTSESDNVSDYDVSQVDGSVAYIANNQVLYVNADGSGRRVLVDGGKVDPNNPFISTISSPVFSIDGQTLAYGYNGRE